MVVRGGKQSERFSRVVFPIVSIVRFFRVLFCLNLIDVEGLPLWEVFSFRPPPRRVAFLRRSIKRLFIFLKKRFRSANEKRKYMNLERAFRVAFIDFPLDSQTAFCLAQSTLNLIDGCRRAKILRINFFDCVLIRSRSRAQLMHSFYHLHVLSSLFASTVPLRRLLFASAVCLASRESIALINQWFIGYTFSFCQLKNAQNTARCNSQIETCVHWLVDAFSCSWRWRSAEKSRNMKH